VSKVRIVSVRAGRVREWPRPEWDHHAERTWRTAYRKDELPGPVRVGALGLAGDEQAARDVHGGPHMAVLAYAAAHYELWRAEPGLEAMGHGGFGENLTWEGADESSVCIGDAWDAERVAIEVSQPRGPCAAISRWWNSPTLLKRAAETGHVGWYLRVSREGDIARGETLRLVSRPNPEWTIERVFRLKMSPAPEPAACRALADLAALSPGWRGYFAERAAQQG
jgi:MOSC domain-containing protein YiiM